MTGGRTGLFLGIEIVQGPGQSGWKIIGNSFQ
jgi:hypothetical protein